MGSGKISFHKKHLNTDLIYQMYVKTDKIMYAK